jgi:hypothetical protein
VTNKVQRPSKVRIGVRTYAIKYLNDDQWHAGDHQDDERGECNNVTGTISVRAKVGEWSHDEPQVREILWHELMHACASTSMAWNTWDMMDKSRLTYDDMEEWMVGGWSPVQLKMMMDNPALMRYLLS